MSKMSKTAEEIEEFSKKAASTLGQQRYQEYRGRRNKERQLWETWHQGGRQEEHMEPLLKSLDPLINRETTKRMAGLGGAISRSALKSELRQRAVDALHDFDPQRGAQLSTHISNKFKAITDWIAANRNPRRLPRPFVDKFQEFKNVQNEFQELHGRNPTSAEIRELKPDWRLRDIKRMEMGFGSEAYTDLGGDLAGTLKSDPGLEVNKYRGAVMLVRGQMSQQEQQYADLAFPPVGQKPKSIKQIARALGVPEHKAYRIKTKVEEKIGPVIKKT